MKRIPLQAGIAGGKIKLPRAAPQPSTGYPSWRIGHFDIESKWGLESLLGPFVFSYSETILSLILETGDDHLNDVLSDLDKKEFDSVAQFWKKFPQEISIPTRIIEAIQAELVRDAFSKDIFPQLRDFETMTWDTISQATHGARGKTKSHFIPISKLIREAKDRLDEIRISDVDEIFSLRLNGLTRIYGFRNSDVLDIIWVDRKHEICPPPKKN